MPTYSYRCTECGTAFDIQQAFTDDSLTECPTCSGKLRKLFSAVGVSFTGSGFYRNDSRPAAAEKKETKSEPAAASSAAASGPASAPSSGPASAPAASSAPASSPSPTSSPKE